MDDNPLADFIVLTEDDVPGATLVQDPKDCTVVQLKRWLTCHGLKQSGKKDVLIDRVTQSRGLIKVDPNVDGGKWYDEKNKISSPPVISSSTKTNIWKIFPSHNIPSMFNYGHIYYYAIESMNEICLPTDDPSDDENDSITEKPLKKGRSLLESGFVENVQDSVTDDGDYALRGHVHHSMKNLPPLNVHVTISRISGNVKSAECTCKASALNRCAHVTALLLYLSEHVKSNGYEPILSSTSKPCVWNSGKKREKNPKPVQNATYKSKKRNASEVYVYDPRPNDCRGVNQELKNEFLINMQSYGSSKSQTPMWLTQMRCEYEDFVLDDADRSIYSFLREEYVTSLKGDMAEISPNIDNFQIPFTINQNESLRWHQERSRRITASICKKVTFLGETLSRLEGFNWLKNHYWFKQHIVTADMQYGVNEEENAVNKFSIVSGFRVVKSGLWVNKKYIHLGASPDGLIFDKSTGSLDAILEVKCLKCLKTQTISEWKQNGIKTSACVKVEDENLVLKTTHMYYFQIQLQLLITEAPICYFILHSKVGDPHVIRVTRDKHLQNRIAEGTYRFWYNMLIPEYFLMRVPRYLLPYDSI